MSAYALLLRSSPATLSSPRSGAGSPATSSFDARKTWRECMEIPAELRTFTFARLCLIPALLYSSSSTGDGDRRGSYEPCDASEFCLAVLADFASSYFDVLSTSKDRPISRAKWQQDAEDDLRLRRLHREQQLNFRGQFGTWSDPVAPIDTVPASVDLLSRPDCMDDVVAFATAVCSLGAQYAQSFWNVDNGIEQAHYTPSRALRELEQQQAEDYSLRASYLSFLAGLAVACELREGENGAVAIHRLLSNGGNSVGGRSVALTWSSLIDILRWYVRELDPQETPSGRSTTTSGSGLGSSGSGSTAYYYFDRGDKSDVTRQAKDRSADLSTSKARELGDENTYLVLSHLSLLACVAKNSPQARYEIASLNLPIFGSNKPDIVGQDSTLMVLFSLCARPFAPAIRGAIFETIANLLSVDGAVGEVETKIRSLARKGWEYLEACQVLPISSFDQYPVMSEGNDQRTTGLSFPPSSTALVNIFIITSKLNVVSFSQQSPCLTHRQWIKWENSGFHPIQNIQSFTKWNSWNHRQAIILQLKVFCFS
jgi:Nuclear pore complex scaffold, nucleoporins 186/192/205